MRFDVAQQDAYSRAELLLRTLFGWLYIGAPHFIVLFFVGIWSAILHFISWWVILLTGRYPASFFEFHVKVLSWNMRTACGSPSSHPGPSARSRLPPPSFCVSPADERARRTSGAPPRAP
jgi:hypothetical protein